MIEAHICVGNSLAVKWVDQDIARHC
jgi:hypothetical protein